jgi:parvulin-like peptidyl-prolyl isomerase
MLSKKAVFGWKLALVLASILLLMACAGESQFDNAGKPFINVDGKVITLSEFNELFEAFRMDWEPTGQAGDLRETRAAFLLQLVEELIILRRGEELGLEISQSELDAAMETMRASYGEDGLAEMFIKKAVSPDTWKRRLKMQLLVDKVIETDLAQKISVEPKDIRAYHEKHDPPGGKTRQIRVRQILVPTKAQADRILKELKGGADFAEVARRRSQAPEAAQGGDMGYVCRGDLPEDLEESVFSLPEGQISPIIPSSYGYHIFKVVQRVEKEAIEADHWLNKAKAAVKRKKLEAAYRPWLDKLRARYKIVVNDEIM